MDSKADSVLIVEKKLYDVQKIRNDFPILKLQVHGKPLVYLDNAATTQKPQYVIDKTNNYYEKMNANIHRGVHALSQEATEAFESSRIIIKNFINALGKNEIIFTRGTTESINLVASSYGRTNVKEGDEIIISTMEHHSNIVPWQMLCAERNAKLRVIPVNDEAKFYLKSRGIGEDAATAILIHAFASDVITSIKIPALRDYLEEIITKRFNQ